MATYASLSDSDKAVVQNTVQLIRGMTGSFARNFNALNAIAADTNAINLILSIDAGDTIPNESGLAGADDMTRSELAAIYNDFVTMRDAHDDAAARAEWSKAAGINALINAG
jgi:hypothetical protein